MFLLDTHAWVWALEDERHLGSSAARLISRAAAQGTLRVSQVSVFEVTALHVAGVIHFNRPLDQWIRGGLEYVRVAELSVDIAIDAGYIPRTALADPADRLLVATARQLDAVFITADRAILSYARAGHVRVHDASR